MNTEMNLNETELETIAGGAIALSNLNFGQIIGGDAVGRDKLTAGGDLTGRDKSSLLAVNQGGVQAFDFSKLFSR